MQGVKREMLTPSRLFLEKSSLAYPFFQQYEFVWEIIPHIKDIIEEIIPSLPKEEYVEREEGVWVHKSAKIAKSVHLGGKSIICEGAEIRHGAFIRGNALIGRECVVGNSSEVKSSILFDKAQIPHYNYVGDSVLGYGAHMGAGAIISNLKSDQSDVTIQADDGLIDTHLRKMGAILGDRVEVGASSVLNPGTIILDHTTIYPLSSVRGVILGKHIYKSEMCIIKKR